MSALSLNSCQVINWPLFIFEAAHVLTFTQAARLHLPAMTPWRIDRDVHTQWQRLASPSIYHGRRTILALRFIGHNAAQAKSMIDLVFAMPITHACGVWRLPQVRAYLHPLTSRRQLCIAAWSNRYCHIYLLFAYSYTANSSAYAFSHSPTGSNTSGLHSIHDPTGWLAWTHPRNSTETQKLH